MTEPRRFTNSEVRTFKRCRRKWYLSQVRRLYPIKDEVTGAAATGTRLHSTLEDIYNGVTVDDALARLAAEAEADCELYPMEAPQIRKDAELVRVMVEGFVEFMSDEGEDEDYEILGVEQIVEVDHPTLPGVRLLGKLDQLVYKISTGEVMFRDWKSVGDFSRVRLLVNDEQLKHYMLLLRLAVAQELMELRDGQQARGGIYAMLKKSKRTARAKPPFYRLETIRHNDTAIYNYFDRLTQEIQDILDVEGAIEAGGDHTTIAYPNPTRDCSWDCPYATVCPMFDDGSDVESVLALNFQERDALARYDDGTSDEETL